MTKLIYYLSNVVLFLFITPFAYNRLQEAATPRHLFFFFLDVFILAFHIGFAFKTACVIYWEAKRESY